ncbi:unnamed protein product [Nezara viridula]|uniref:Uncharacterized protein n=1 Tax=Nezara viridula TaxID=85310 RepID=A0A9P0H3Y3_NEZVI|nr:unnamed protein product [Nezara viridula]
MKLEIITQAIMESMLVYSKESSLSASIKQEISCHFGGKKMPKTHF